MQFPPLLFLIFHVTPSPRQPVPSLPIRIPLSRQATDMSDSSPPTPNNNITTNTNTNSITNINKIHSPSLIIRPCCQTKFEETPTSFVETTMKAESIDSNYDAAAVKRSVKEINFGGHDEKAKAAAEIRRLAKADGRTKRLLAELGIVPPLVAMMVEYKELRCSRLAVEALVELASGSFRNKKLIVEAGLLSKLPQLMHNNKALARERQFAQLLLSISSLAKTQFPLDSRRLLPFLVDILDDESTCEEVKLTSVATLYNLSAKLDNTRPIVASGAVRSLLKLSTNASASEGALVTLGNLVASAVGKKAIENEPSVVEAFGEILGWDDKPRCQELAAYLLMVVAHKSATQREEIMSRSGTVVPRLLEVALLGSPLARKRALKLLQWLKDDRGTRVAVHSGPQARLTVLRCCSSNPVAEEDVEEGRRAVRAMVKQSLDRNMESIMRRATGGGGGEGPLGLKSLVATSSSKSLPY